MGETTDHTITDAVLGFARHKDPSPFAKQSIASVRIVVDLCGAHRCSSTEARR